MLEDIPESLPMAETQDVERLQAALVLPAHGDVIRLAQRLRLAREDWRDALVGAGLGNEDWPAILDAQLGL